MNERFNLNTVLLTIVLALSAWTLKKVSDMGEEAAATAVRVDNHTQQIGALSGRVDANSRDIVDLRVARKP